jgi:micrococcal nuclease
VVRVVDGDTIHVEVGGRREKVRYIGVDTPESVKPVQCFHQARERVHARLLGGADRCGAGERFACRR